VKKIKNRFFVVFKKAFLFLNFSKKNYMFKTKNLKIKKQSFIKLNSTKCIKCKK